MNDEHSYVGKLMFSSHAIKLHVHKTGSRRIRLLKGEVVLVIERCPRFWLLMTRYCLAEVGIERLKHVFHD